MEEMKVVIYILEMIGTIAFASSGAMMGIREKMDILGVNIMGLVTAVGGGVIRDLILGITPPKMFSNWSYVVVAIIMSTGLFLVIYMKRDLLSSTFLVRYENLMVLLDAIGLGIFTVVGMNTAIELSYDNALLLMFVGIITGVGGGILRDMMACRKPFILVKHVYASASLLGAAVYIIFIPYVNQILCMCFSICLIVVIRILSARFRWNLPRVE